MKTITLRDLHHKTGEWVRAAARHGELAITDRGRIIAKIIPQGGMPEVSYFARRTPSPAFPTLEENGGLHGGTGGTALISEECDAR